MHGPRLTGGRFSSILMLLFVCAAGAGSQDFVLPKIADRPYHAYLTHCSCRKVQA